MNDAYFTLNKNVDNMRNPDREMRDADFKKNYK